LFVVLFVCLCGLTFTREMKYESQNELPLNKQKNHDKDEAKKVIRSETKKEIL